MIFAEIPTRRLFSCVQTLQSLYGCPCSAVATCVCERRLHGQLDAARVAAANAGQRVEQQAAQTVQPLPLQQPEQRTGGLQQPEQRLEHAAGQAAAAEAPAPAWFAPDGYELPEECAKHEPLYAGIFDSLRPWSERGVTREDMDACLPVAPAGHDVSTG